MLSRLLACGVVAMLLTGMAAAQAPTPRDRAMGSYDSGLEYLLRENFEAAAQSFRNAVIIDPMFEMAFYMLGRTQLMQRNYVAAVVSLERARDIYQAQGTERFTTKAERQQVLRQRLDEIERSINETQAAAARPANATRAFSMQEQVRQYQERKRQIQDMIRSEEPSAGQAVPGFVSLSLGSAYFRAGRVADAERAYLAALAADGKIGEAHNNLAVIYMESGRFDDAEKAVKLAEKTGFKVQPALKEEIQKRRKS